MGGRNSGFASMTKSRLKDTGSRGGKNASKSPKKREWSKEEALAAAAASVQKRIHNLAVEAFKRLVNAAHFDAEELASLGLTDKELVYYGGRTAPPRRIKELQGRLDNAKNDNTGV